MSEDDFFHLAAVCLARLSAQGIEVRAIEDIEKWEAELVMLGKRPNHPMISPGWHDFTFPEAFGLIFQRDGASIGGVAARFHDLGREPLGAYWARSYKRLYGGGEFIPVESPAMRASRDVIGKVVYLGELFITKEERKEAGDLSALVMNYLFLLCAVRWRPNWLYGFVRHEDAVRGKPTQYGFPIVCPGAQTWHEKIEERSTGEFFVAISCDDLKDQAAYYRRHPEWFVRPRERHST